MNSGNGEGNPLFAGNSLVSRLYTDSKGSKSLNPNKARGTVLSTSKSTPSMKKPNDLVLQYTNAKLEPSPIGGNVKTLLQSSPIKQLKSSDRPDGFIQDRPIKYEPPPTASERLVTTFIDSLNLSAKEKFDLFHIPQYFMYLQRKPEQENTMHEVPRSVYDLETVNQDKVDKVVYFTISKEGITQFAKDSSHFTPLDKWEREFKIFHKMAKINFFKLYKRWKAFTVWKKSLSYGKMRVAAKALSASLFLFCPPLRTALLLTRGQFLSLSNSGLISCPTNETFKLDKFIDLQHQVHTELRLKLDKLSLAILASVRAACDEVVDQFLKVNNIVADHKMTFMERASLRAECKRLTRFLRLVDIMMAGFLKTILLDAVELLMSVLHSATMEPSVEFGDIDAKALNVKRAEKSIPTPLFEVAVSYNDQTVLAEGERRMLLSPSPEEFSGAIKQIIDESLEVVSSFTKVFSSPDTEMYVMPMEGADDDAEKEDIAIDIASDIRSSARFVDATKDIEAHFNQVFEAIESYINVFEPFIDTYLDNLNYVANVDSKLADSEVAVFLAAIQGFHAQIERFQSVPSCADVGVLFVDSASLKALMIPSPLLCLNAIKSYVPQLTSRKAQELHDEVHAMNPVISVDPSTVEAFVLKKKTKEIATNGLEAYKNRQFYVNQLNMLLEENSWPVPDDLKALIAILKSEVDNLEVNIQPEEGKEEEEIKKFTVQVTEDCGKLRKKVADLRGELDKAIYGDPTQADEYVLKQLSKLQVDLTQYKESSEKIKEYQEILKIHPVDEFEDVDEVSSDFALKQSLWSEKAEWFKLREKILSSPINTFDVGLVEKELFKMNKIVVTAGKRLPNNKVVPILKQSVHEFNPVLPVVSDLRNPCLKERHWKQISDLTGIDFQNAEDFTLFDLIDKKVTDHQDAISTIATAAQQESILEDMMAKINAIWDSADFEVKNYKEQKDLYILGDTSEVIGNLDDSLVTINTILGSRYVAGIRATVDTLRSKLMHFQETLDEWLTCQKNWMYLETIFSSPDIVKQLPVAAKTFQAVDKSWKHIMKATSDEPNALKAGTKDKTRLDVFKTHNENLDKIQKELEDYLETKRKAFPRFYFLSNDELLEILSQAKDPKAVQPHLRKCFDNLVKLEFSADENSNDILAMYSSENEKVGLGKNLVARGNVESWLKSVEERMKKSLQSAMKMGLLDYDTKARDEWTACHPGQIIATVAQMTWARDTEAALRAADPIDAMNKWAVQYKAELQKLIVKIRGNLTKLVRYIIVALVTTDVHARDIIDELIEQKVDSVQNFLWQQQLRYYWDIDIDDCTIKHSDAVIRYGYEYMGATSRLVITPLTDRCWLTLTGSYALKLGAAPAGPAGTGKTESSKDLAKAIGIQCVVFNCSDQIDYKMMGKLFRGLAQGGSWVCLDEFNRIDIEVLSVVAQQLLVLRNGRQMKKDTINFMGIQISLQDHHVIITMNPGYAGRTELPDNLAVCFRPVSMMVPNYALIAEIMLFAEGFGDAKNLSQKMCKLYILCSEQLSQQPHYDYGLRAVKSVLVMAGGLKRANPDTPEELVLIRALRDSNVPKFLADDLPLFAAIVQDLFPGVSIPSNDYGELQVALEEETLKAGLQIVPNFQKKIIQMFDIFNIRFGATLVGPAGTGKSTCYRILAALMINLREKGSANQDFQRVKIRILNPKCITMGELYGEFSALTQEWHDGLASSIMREFAAEEGDEKRWTVFDGPIDALWIENMNTVLDDNMTLCLANGQRIKLKNEMKCLFEVNDLAVASPATVSRIGVVYMTPSDLGWIPFVKSWVARDLPNECSAPIKEILIGLFETVFLKGLAFQRKYLKEPVETVDIQLVISLCTLFQSLFVANNGVNFSGPLNELKSLTEKLFLFSYVWAVGAPCASSFWERFDESTREIFDEACTGLGLPPSGTVFDYFLDIKSGKFCEWSSIVPSFVYDENAPYFNLVVPTTDTCRFSYVMKSLITVNKPCFITGVTGTGKTVAVQSLLNSLQPLPSEGGMGVLPIFMNFSAQTQSIVTQSTIESKLEKKRKNLLGAPAGRKVVVFVDDINMPNVETYGAQAPIELLRQFLDFKGFYDRDKLFWKDITDVLLFVAAAPPGGGRSTVTPRFSRHFNVLCIPPASNAALTLIFESILSAFLGQKFPSEVQRMSKGIVAATIEIYQRISEELLPTPARFHYLFNLRDISKVFQGILMIKAKKCDNVNTFSYLWVHESMRIFYDRLINEDDQKWFKALIVELSARHLKMPHSADDLFAKPVVFADFLKPELEPKERMYEEIKDLGKLTFVLNDLLDTYNATFPTQMNLVFFMDALTHTARISRILRQPRGNIMLIGVGGSGKQSLTTMAAYVAGMQLESIKITRGYGINEFREDIKKYMMTMSKMESKDLVFLFTDSQIVDETMLEDLNNVLNTGEIPNLFAQDEMDRVVADMVPICKAAGIPETRDNCVALFVSRVRDMLHIVLCMSPVGDSLRIRCRQFPSLINCTTIDWFHGWPEAALVNVAERFLGALELPSEEIRGSVVQMCGYVHRSIEMTSDRFYNELRRRVYTTPKSYLDLINLYMSMLKGLQDIVEEKTQRMRVGVEKLNETNSLVDGLKNELVKLEPVLKQKTIETAQLLEQVAKDSEAANLVAEKVQAEELIVGKQAEETSAVAADAQADLDKALPALEGAMKALQSLSKSDITEVKSFANPPPAVQIVMNAVCVMLGQAENWDSAKKLLGQSNFMEQLVNYDKDNIPDNRLKNLRKNYINLEEMQVEVISKVSRAGKGLCQWVRAINGYADVAKEVGPKKERLDLMNAQLASANAELAEKRAQLKEVTDKVAELQRICNETLADKNRLQEESETTARRLERAEKLTSGLNSEGERWKSNIVTLAAEKINLIGDCFLSCACISYYGGFTGQYRDRLIGEWLEQARSLKIPASEKFLLVNTLGNPVQIREWQNQGLPTDDVSVNNGILVDKCRRWPLMIDPQQQANKWLKKKEEENGVEVTTMRDVNLLRVLETCIRNGKSLIIEDLGEQIEPALEPILQKAIYKSGNRLLVRLGDTEVDYDSRFRLFMTTKLPNPHYLPEVWIKVTLINFTVTMEGLEAQLLGAVVAAESPEIEHSKVRLLLEMAENKKTLQTLEATILQKLSDSSGKILDNVELINTLSESKLKASLISKKVAEAEVTEQNIAEARAKYQSVATRGSIIYFVIADLASIDPMYQYSLEYFANLFNRCLDEAPRTNPSERLLNIIEYSTFVIYENICRGLFEKDKLLFSACICFQIMRQSKKIHDFEWNMFMRGPGAVNRSHQPANPYPDKITVPMWDLLYTAEHRLQFKSKEEEAGDAPVHHYSQPHPFEGLCDSIAIKYNKDWKHWMESADIMDSYLPDKFQQVSFFQRLILVKALREDKIQSAIASFVSKNLGPKFASSPNASMEDIYKDLDNKTPCIFILSTGADPTGMLLRFARKRNYEDRLQIVSLGQGQGPVAQHLIHEGMRTGDWVILQNCMLAKSWMGELDRLVFELQVKAKQANGGVHPDFRLYLTSAPASYFPVSVLQIGVKMTNEPPKGFKANLTRSFSNLVKPDDYENCTKPLQWKKLLCGLAFFHANIQERRKFGPLGWNIRYAFDESDLETSIAVLRRFLEEQEFLPWDALNYVTGQINYGGRVTDDWDRRCLMSILSIYMVPGILENGYKFSASGVYYAPQEGHLPSVFTYFDSLPTTDDPEVFGMHENANVTFNTNESLNLMAAILSLQPRSSGSGSGISSDDIVIELATTYESMLPALLLRDDAGPTTFVIQENGLLTSLAICLDQEMIKFNRLLEVMASSLRDIKKAIKGMIVMSSDLDSMYSSFLNNQLPAIWERVSFASLKTLGSWVTDLIFRVNFMREWLKNGQPAVFPLPVFFFPQGFMTASLQTFARRHMKSIDRLSFEFSILSEAPEAIKEGPDDGVYIYGLYLEGARFDRDRGMVVESEPGRMYDLLPVIHFKPAEGHKQAPGTYCCPVYKTAVRKGVLSTTGMSTNFVVAVELPSDMPEQKWILAGVAALCNLTD